MSLCICRQFRRRYSYGNSVSVAAYVYVTNAFNRPIMYNIHNNINKASCYIYTL